MADGINPIYSVKAGSGTPITNLPAPSSYQWKMEDVSKGTAGRNEVGYMYKEQLQQIVGIELSWAYLTTAQANAVLSAFNHEYITVKYLDPLFGNASDNYYTTKEFYVGDRTAPLYSTVNNMWTNISFNLIARGVNL